MRSRTHANANALADAIRANVACFWAGLISYEAFKRKADALWDAAREADVADLVTEIVVAPR